MKDFVKMFFAALLAGVVLTFLPFFMFMGMVSMISALSEDEVAGVKDNSMLVVDLSTPIMDCVVEDPMSRFSPESLILGGGVQDENTLALKDLTDAITRAATDDRIKGMVLSGSGFSGGMAQLMAVEKALKEFKESGKPIVSYAENYTQGEYILKSLSTKLFLNPNGGVDLKGLATQMPFYKGFLEKYGIDVQIFRVGKFKSAVEPYMETKMSEANREQNLRMLESVWDTISTIIAENRGLSHADVCEAAATRTGMFPQEALGAGLVDTLSYYEGYASYIKDTLGVKNKISIVDYIAQPSTVIETAKKKIAVIYAEGEIVDESVAGSISTKSVRKDIEKVIKDTNVVAVVLRVNSPGGSALASDNIWYSLEELQKEKPVVVSMGNYAASGGYYISCGSDYIFAEPTTLTGSIGVFGVIPNVSKLASKHGITIDEVAIYPNSIDPSLLAPVSKGLAPIIQKNIESVYTQFLSRVAEGRGKTTDEIHEIAQGRVWTGSDAIEIGLVDEIGGLYDAIEKAASIAGVEEYRVIQTTNPKKSIDAFMELLGGSKDDEIRAVVGDELADMLGVMREISDEDKPRVMARMPYGYRIDF
ncbi:MAG: signal peptide peptidase SppA [Flavobacteriales bacterium]|nr:signal peptide peptidase SppA [Flavobacteriales bacterium]